MPTQDPAGTDDRRREAPDRTILPAAGPSGAPPVAIDRSYSTGNAPTDPDPAEAEFERLTGHPTDARPSEPPAGEAERPEPSRPG
jgi:hypothetical protein